MRLMHSRSKACRRIIDISEMTLMEDQVKCYENVMPTRHRKTCVIQTTSILSFLGKNQYDRMTIGFRDMRQLIIIIRDIREC